MGTFVENINKLANDLTVGFIAGVQNAQESTTTAIEQAAIATAMATVCTDIYDQFDDKYLGPKATAPTVDNDGNALAYGALYFDTTQNFMKVWSNAGWINAGSSVNGTTERYTYHATAGQTVFAATYEAGYIDVFLNGSKLENGVDFTAVTSTNITLAVGANVDDVVDIICYAVFELSTAPTKDVVAYTVSTVGDLASVPSSYTTAIVKDLDRGGTFIWSSTGTANGGTVFAGATGYWNRQYSGAINVKWFGVISGGIINTQASMQLAWDYAYANDCQVDIDAGKYLVDTITFPPALPADTRGNAFKVVGAGAGNAFVINPPQNACTFIGSGNAPVLHYVNRLSPTINTGGAWNVSGIRFQANSSSAPAVLLDMIGEYSYFGECEIYQAGDGDGLEIDYFLKANIERINIINKHYVSPVGTTRVGAGVRIKSGASGGIPTLKKITSRGFLSAYIIGENAYSTHNMSGLKMEQCECSTVGTGIDIRPYTLKATLDTCYFEGIEATHIKDQGTMTLITGGMHYGNIDATNVIYYDGNYGTYGNTFIGNYLETNCDGDTLISINGNYNKTLKANYLLYAGTTATNVTGIKIYGIYPNIDISGNAFLPRGNWLGTGTKKISKQYTEPLLGFIQAQNGSDFSCDTLVGAISYMSGQSTITESSITGNLLTLVDGVNFFDIAPTTVKSINQIIATGDTSQPITFNVTNANTTFTNSAYLKLAGGTSFTGIGMITFMVIKTGASYYAYETSRANYV